MSNLTLSQAGLTMTSREIAELCEKRHADVRRDIRNMLETLKIGVSKFAHTYLDSQNKEQEEYLLPKDLTLTLVAGYRVEVRYRLVKRWEQLESNVIAMPNFTDPAEAAIAWAKEYREKQEAQLERDRAIATKAEIGSRREATAMGTASAAVRKVNKLKIELDQSQQYCTVKRMQMIHHGQKFNWRLLKSTASEMGLPPKDVFDANYGTVKAYHLDVWKEAYAVNIEQDSSC